MRLLFSQLCHLVQQCDRLCWTCYPCSRACQPGLEVVGAYGEELVADVECLLAFDLAKVALTGEYAPRLVTDVDEDVVASVECAKGQHLCYV